MSGSEKEISDIGSFGGVGIPNDRRKGTTRVNEQQNQSSELLDATGMGRYNCDTSQKGGMYHE